MQFVPTSPEAPLIKVDVNVYPFSIGSFKQLWCRKALTALRARLYAQRGPCLGCDQYCVIIDGLTLVVGWALAHGVCNKSENPICSGWLPRCCVWIRLATAYYFVPKKLPTKRLPKLTQNVAKRPRQQNWGRRAKRGVTSLVFASLFGAFSVNFGVLLGRYFFRYKMILGV